jgi:membrane-associated protease RseP (regulator of RpoE activity)
MGAVIRIRSPWPSRTSLFDVGIAGPIAGFIVAVSALAYGVATLPGKEYIYAVHPEYAQLDGIPQSGFALGNSFFFSIIRSLYTGNGFFPPMNEIYHYPYLCVGWFGLFVTALNLIPVGQLDGGHILYALIGKKWHGIIARTFFVFLLALGVSSFLHLLYGSVQTGTMGWLLWAVILYFIVKIDHPEVTDTEQLTRGRQVLGWAVFLIFVLAFTPLPFVE